MKQKLGPGPGWLTSGTHLSLAEGAFKMDHLESSRSARTSLPDSFPLSCPTTFLTTAGFAPRESTKREFVAACWCV